MTSVMQLSVYGLIGLASVMLAIAEGNTFPDSFTIPLAVLALFLTERWKLFCLRIRWANCLGLTAFALGAWEFFHGNAESRLLSLAHVLVYLTWIVLFLEKTTRMYWTMCALAVLHVAVGSVLTSASLFGLLAVLFLAMSIWTLSIFTLYRARQSFSGTQGTRTLTAPGGLVFPWNFPSRAESTVQLDSRQQWIGLPLVMCVAMTIGLSGVMGAIFFALTPRIWIGSISPFTDAPDTALRILKTGFTEEVRLGDIGQILESTHQVFEVRLIDEKTQQPVSVTAYAESLGMDEPLFRGAVLGEYTFGRWRTEAIGNQNYATENVPAVATRPDVIRQEYRLEPTESEALFAIPPHHACRLEAGRGKVRQRSVSRVLFRETNLTARDAVSYVVYSEKPRRPVEPMQVRATTRGMFNRLNPPEYVLDYYARLPASGLERMQQLARREAGIETGNADPVDQARRLSNYLRNSGEYQYSLDASVQDPNIDAVEDFLFNRKRGHCEYFASSLTLMLRAVGIPARLASGFKGGDLNESTGYFIVQQRHAHVWVEAFLNQQWIILDPTPASRSDSVKSLAPKDTLFSSLHRFFNDLWSHQVVGMSMAEQRTNVYEPLKNLFTTTIESIPEVITESFGEDKRSLGPRVFVLSTLVILVVLLIVFWVIPRPLLKDMETHGVLTRWWHGFVRLWNWILPAEPIAASQRSWRGKLRGWWDAAWSRWFGRTATSTMRVEFYERFLRLLKRAGWQPQVHQTPREFLLASEPKWREQLWMAGLRDIPERIVAQYYRVRFGRETLTADEAANLERNLTDLERALLRRGRHRTLTP